MADALKEHWREQMMQKLKYYSKLQLVRILFRRDLSHFGALLELLDGNSRIGVCLDTCHLFASGYELAPRESYERFFNS